MISTFKLALAGLGILAAASATTTATACGYGGSYTAPAPQYGAPSDPGAEFPQTLPPGVASTPVPYYGPTYGTPTYGPPNNGAGATYVNGNLVYNPGTGGGAAGAGGAGCLALSTAYNAQMANGWYAQARMTLHFYRMCMGYRS